ncbi:MAG: methyltransferase domain-containing protein [Methanobacteriota archaeon]|nr:MAG: methyltransferase domain-containing protein [Euryarchaeota archaeon]
MGARVQLGRGAKPLFLRLAMPGMLPGHLSFDRVATIYDETRSLPPRAMARVLAVLVDELHRKRVLEIGVGTGRYAVPLQKSGIRVVGVDISRRMVEFGLAKGLRDVVFAEGAHLPFARHSFDIATTNHVLHLIANWRQVFAEIVRVTRELYFTVIERSQRVDSIQRDYDALLREVGYEYHHPGIHERDLPDLVKPDIVIPVGPFHETIPANILLEEFAGRAYSGQWEVPESIHREAIARLRHQWGGKEYERSYNLEVTFWRIDRIPELAKAKVQKS